MTNIQKGFIAVVILVLLVVGTHYYANSNSRNQIMNFDTKVTAYINSIQGNKITLDYFDSLSGEEAKKAAVADGFYTQEEIDNGQAFPNGEIYFRNQDSELKTFNLSSNVAIIATTAFSKNTNGGGGAILSVQELKKDYVDIRDTEGERSYYPFEITLSSKGEVVMIKEIYTP